MGNVVPLSAKNWPESTNDKQVIREYVFDFTDRLLSIHHTPTPDGSEIEVNPIYHRIKELWDVDIREHPITVATLESRIEAFMEGWDRSSNKLKKIEIEENEIWLRDRSVTAFKHYRKF